MAQRVMWLLYQWLTLGVLLLIGPFLLARRGSHYLQTLQGRFGRSTLPQRAHPLWIHAVSVGEVEVARTLLDRLRQGSHSGELLDFTTLVTTVTPTGQRRAAETLSQTARIDYLPFELGLAQDAFLRRNRPGSLVLIEGEMWPLLMRRLKRRQVPIVMINGRISDRSFARLRGFQRRLPGLIAPLLDPVDHFGVQTKQDRDRLQALGVPPDRITVTGNLKFDAAPPPQHEELGRLVSDLAGGRPVIVAGSTMAGEEQFVLQAQTMLSDLNPLLILAPRHPERFAEVEQLCQSYDLACLRRSNLGTATAASTTAPCVLLLDTLGELASTYRWAGAAFVGGTLVNTGGHNPLEPARCGAPTCVGPSMQNFKEIADVFDTEGAWQRVADAEELATVWRRWLQEPETATAVVQRATALVERNRGATDRSIQLLEQFAPQALGKRPATAEARP